MNPDDCFKINLSDALNRLPGPQDENVVTLFEHGSLVVKLYAPRGNDDQSPHSRDEVYVVALGTGEFVCGDARQTLVPQDVLFAAAGIEHRFENFSEDFAVWVFFYGPEDGEVDQG
ncbi:MAG TPA: cupin domain-containing protein [Pyrinomonadaceae bacterium]|jgi:mannose-6-phosphate isomerase-like protein (cupin superfamily)|nr:cupin domain-containing protein [Pyrinomonadaceae bacterium]